MGKKVAEMLASHQEFLDRVETTTTCAFCPSWEFLGPAAEGRERAAEHRRSAHPDLRPRSRAQIEKEARREKDEAAKRRKEERVAAKTTVPSTNGSSGSIPVPAADDFAARRRRRTPYSREEILDRFRLFHEQFGRYPTQQDIRTCAYLPSQNGVEATMGSWRQPFVELGWPPPVKGRRRSNGANPPEVPPRPQETLSQPPASGFDLLVAFLYTLVRDRLTLGAVEAVVRDVEQGKGKRFVFSNAHAEAYARDVAARLLESAAG